MLKQKPLQYVLLLLTLLLYVHIGYRLQRYETVPLLTSYFILFLLFIVIARRTRSMNQQELSFWLMSSVLFRAVLFFAVPALSDDFYRFIWDGRLIAAGYNPFAAVPSWYMEQNLGIPGIDAALYDKLNSKATFTNYPPFAQLLFWFSTQFSDGTIYGSLLTMRVVILLFDVATLWILRKTLLAFSRKPSTILLYAANPLIVLELTGNLHYEGIMVFFLFAAILLLKNGRTLTSGVAYALSVCTKLVTLLFLPLLVRYLGWKKSIAYWLVAGVVTVACFTPLMSQDSLAGYSTSMGYYFQRFEFNASLYYIVRAIGFWVFGFNIIAFAGPALGAAAALVILCIAFRNFPAGPLGKLDIGLFNRMVWCVLAYLLATPILHPWYIITLLAVSLLTSYRFPVIWSALIFLSYAGYTRKGFEENLALVALEYTGVMLYLLYETVWNRSREHS